MKLDIILSGVGGQGILSIATIIAEAATQAGLYLKQAEVHGMSQRGGDVQSNLRLSTEEIHSDLIPVGKADLIISMEPMEALRYVTYLSAEGHIVTSSTPFVNIPNYPGEDVVNGELSTFPHVTKSDIGKIAAEAGNPKGSNMVLLGMASQHIGILTPEQLRNAISSVFKVKGDTVVAANLRAFDEGIKAGKQ